MEFQFILVSGKKFARPLAKILCFRTIRFQAARECVGRDIHPTMTRKPIVNKYDSSPILHRVPRQGSCMPLRMSRKAVLRIQTSSHAGTRASAAVREIPSLSLGLVGAGFMDDHACREHAGECFVCCRERQSLEWQPARR